MHVSLTSALYLVGFVQSVYLLVTTPVHRGRAMLLLFLGTIALLTTDYFIWENNWLSPTTQFWVNRFSHASLPYLLGPSLYLYIRLQTSESFQLTTRHLWHGLPYALGLVAAIFLIPYYLPNYRTATEHWLFPATTWPQLVRGTHLVVYVGLAGQFLWQQRRQPHAQSFGHTLLVLILVLGLGSALVGTGTYLLADAQPAKLHWQQVSALFAVAMTYLLNRLVIEHRFNQLGLSPARGTHSAGNYVALPQQPREVADAHPADSVSNPAEAPLKYQHSALDPTSAFQLFERLETYLATTRAYEDADLTLPQLAQTLSVSANHLSQVINQVGNQPFYELINRHRIEAACQLLSDARQQHLSVLGIGYEVGFRSKSTYYAAFRRERSMTPNAYRKQMNNRL
ncbi:helix-turn-helix transcriptional regulator [Spirosoma sordidisoli]|uniref:AraC family transcriptional regulator n=1 Tax=Spirosoma sordidisoli TaxID=2502893 RepID=A0A4Q2UGN7_9BACT|nr:helix-turn-helix domain-containing protein [Spirosoma sordidisoli]RYC66585.1 AraC family transcriptional regulator [Spirosoma sordidisoli]